MYTSLRQIPRIAAALAAGILMSTPVFSAGSAGIEVGLDNARVLGKGNAGVADPQDASTQIYNPAGLSQLKRNDVMAGATILVPNFEFKSASGSDETGPVTPSYIPTVAMAFQTPVEKLTLGFSVNSPFGLANQYSSTGRFKYTGYSNQVQEIAYTLNATYEVTPSLSISGGLVYADVDLRQNTKLNSTFINNSNGVPGSFADADTESDMAGHGMGMNAAVYWKANDRWAFGALYRSRLAAHVNGDYSADNIQGGVMQAIFGGSTFHTSVDTDVIFPDSLVVGALYTINDRTNVEVDFGWTGWSNFKQFDFTYGTTNAVLSLNDPLRQTFEDAFSLNVGVSHKLNDQWTLLGGYAFFEQAATEPDYSNVFPDGDRHTLTTGLECALGKGKLSVAYAVQFTADETIDNSVGLATANTSIDGTYDTTYQIVTTSMSYPLG